MKTKIALITGGSRGLGRDMALSLAKNGTDILFTYHSNKEKANEVIKEIENLGQKAWTLPLDTAKTTNFDAFFREVSTVLESATANNKFDYLVNNAGTALYKSFVETTEEELDNMINIHFKGVYMFTQKALPFLNDGGRIVNISSGLARFSFPGSSAYGAMKGAIDVLSRYMAKELGEKRITVNSVAPGAIQTDFGGGRVRDDKQMNETISALTALGRPGLPEDIGGVVTFLCSEQGRWINGQRIEVSGGIFL
ncbi:SDR family NAD(P)-dependent oxidoreductase [Neptunitalea lumnitzerae]|uniref:Short-chain dehydrogenase n=1 Tax=Neptunitalea lumnitzerae TaxID=2965509 RepID=A0ABQ5MET1_9FLAO|nr:SDR family oxidoreductase [Neptunitalea sp. Y10]GLB47857.1 short-chain dehydrogenase [Neptunitalea sp. Y10]